MEKKDYALIDLAALKSALSDIDSQELMTAIQSSIVSHKEEPLLYFTHSFVDEMDFKDLSVDVDKKELKRLLDMTGLPKGKTTPVDLLTYFCNRCRDNNVPFLMSVNQESKTVSLSASVPFITCQVNPADLSKVQKLRKMINLKLGCVLAKLKA